MRRTRTSGIAARAGASVPELCVSSAMGRQNTTSPTTSADRDNMRGCGRPILGLLPPAATTWGAPLVLFAAAFGGPRQHEALRSSYFAAAFGGPRQHEVLRSSYL